MTRIRVNNYELDFSLRHKYEDYYFDKDTWILQIRFLPDRLGVNPTLLEKKPLEDLVRAIMKLELLRIGEKKN